MSEHRDVGISTYRNSEVSEHRAMCRNIEVSEHRAVTTGEAFLISRGRLFHSLGAIAEKARPPQVDRVRGISSIRSEDDLSCRDDLLTVSKSLKYAGAKLFTSFNVICAIL